MKPHSWGWLCNSLLSLLSNYTSIWAKTNFTPASSDRELKLVLSSFFILCWSPATFQIEMCLGEPRC